MIIGYDAVLMQPGVLMNLKYRIEYRLIRSRRRTICIEVTSGGDVVVKAPFYTPVREIEDFLFQKMEWIGEKRQEVFDRLINEDGTSVNLEPIDERQIRELAGKMKKEFVPRVREYARIMNITVGRISIRTQKTRWGSCTSEGNLNFNCLLFLAPAKVQDYVIVHELCHRIEMNHSKRFWELVSSYIPDYKESKKWLDTEGKTLMLRAFGADA